MGWQILIIFFTFLLFFSCGKRSDSDAIKQMTDDSIVERSKEKEPEKKKQENYSLQNDVDSVSYALGLNFGINIAEKGFDRINLVAMASGINDAMKNNSPVIAPGESNRVLNEYIEQNYLRLVANNIKEGEEFLLQNSKKKNIQVLKSGLQVEVLEAGSGELPDKMSEVLLHYEGFFADGTMFDSTIKKRKPLKIVLGRDPVIKAWKEVLPQMKTGSKWKIYVPAVLGYGADGYRGVVEPYKMLIFEMQIVGISK